MYVVTCGYNFEGDLTYYNDKWSNDQEWSTLVARTTKLSEARVFGIHEDARGAALKRPHENNAQVMPISRKELFIAVLQGI